MNRIFFILAGLCIPSLAFASDWGYLNVVFLSVIFLPAGIINLIVTVKLLLKNHFQNSKNFLIYLTICTGIFLFGVYFCSHGFDKSYLEIALEIELVQFFIVIFPAVFSYLKWQLLVIHFPGLGRYLLKRRGYYE